MKRTGGLYPKICDFENLHAAWRKAKKGKTRKTDVMAFEADLEKNLHAIRNRLVNKTWTPGPYATFTVYDSKPRIIAAARFRDRVVHHALVNVLEPLFKPLFIYDLYSNRKGKGTHAGMRRAKMFSQRHAYVLHADVHHYFSSVDRGCLISMLGRKIKCRDTLELVARILDINQPGLETGLPLGNQTSQFFANVYLNPVDHFIKEELRVGGYLRYVDDMWLFGHEKEQIWAWKRAVESRLKELGLRFKPNGTTVYRVRDGFPCLGYRVYPWITLIRRKAVLRLRRNIRRLREKYSLGRCCLSEVKCSLMGSMGHFSQAATGRLSALLMKEGVFARKTR